MNHRHRYIDTSHFRAPYASVPFAGLGQWPAGRSYWDTSNFLAPYTEGYFQDNTLLGLGNDPLPEGVTLPSSLPSAYSSPPNTTWLIAGGAAVAALAALAYAFSR